MDYRQSAPDPRPPASANGVRPEGEEQTGRFLPEDEHAPEDVEECLRLLDEVWPRDDGPSGEIPRELGRFRILGELGRGGFGVVFLAEDSLLNRRVAVKVPRVEILTASESWRRFLREARAAARLHHANLVPLLEAGAVGPVGYIVSTYVPGPSLEQWLAHHSGGVPPRWAAKVIAGLARGIEHVHGQDILHRDLKPANVLMDAPGIAVDPADPSTWAEVPADAWTPRICDFGLAKLHEIEEEETRSRVVCGSPPYMAPEQADSRRDQIGPATDIYGLGAILYQLLTGRPPFGGKSNLETLRRVVTEEPVPPRRRRAGIPRDLETICLKCLEKAPERRYAAADLADDLSRFLEGRTIAARPTSAWERGFRWTRRNPAAAALVGSLILAAGAGIGGLLWHDRVLGRINEELRREALRAEHHASDAEAQRRVAVRQLSGSQLFQAHLSATSGRYERARRVLEFTATDFSPPGPPTFPWLYVREMVRDHIEVLEGHRGKVNALAISADGRSLASGDDTGAIRIWEVQGGRCRLTLTGPRRSIERLAWSPDGTALASADREAGEVRVWEVASGRDRGPLHGTGLGEPIWALDFGTDGKSVRAVGPRRDPGAATARRWDVSRPAGPFPEVPVDGRPSADPSPSDERIRHLLDLLDGVPVPAVLGAHESPGQGPPVLAFTRDRALGVMALGGGTFEVLRNGSWTRLATIHLRRPDNVVVIIDPKDRREAASRPERDRLGRMARALVPRFRRKTSAPGPLAEGFDAWSSTSGSVGGELAIWNEFHKRLTLVGLDEGVERRVTELGPLGGVQSSALGPDGATLAVGMEDRTIRLWHRRPARRALAIEAHAPLEAWAVDFSPDGRTIASSGDDHAVRLWDAATGREQNVFREHHSLVTCLDLSPDGRFLASGSLDRRNPLVIRDRDAGWEGRRLPVPALPVRSLAFSPDGRILASGSEEGTMTLWDAKDGRHLVTIDLGRPRWIDRLSFSPDGTTIAACGVSGFTLAETATGETRSFPMDNEVTALIFSRDGSLLLIGLKDGSLRTWDVPGRREIRRVQGHAGLVLELALAPDGVVLASAGEDGTVRLWDVATSQELLCLTDCRARVNSVAFSRDGLSLAAADHSGAVTIWDAHPRR